MGMSVHDRRLSASLWRHIIEKLHIYNGKIGNLMQFICTAVPASAAITAIPVPAPLGFTIYPNTDSLIEYPLRRSVQCLQGRLVANSLFNQTITNHDQHLAKLRP